MINAAARMISKEGRAGALIVTGTDKIRSGYGNGDCVLMDFGHAVFALSDSTERHARASRELLERLHGSIAESGTPDDIAGWRNLVNGVFALQNYRHKATFSCVALSSGRSGVITLTALNGGDSAIFVINVDSGKVEYVSSTDMYFAGRSREIAHAAELNLADAEYRVVLCSDGLSDIAKLHGNSVPEMLLAAAGSKVGEVPARFREIVGAIDGLPGAEYDDTGVLVLDPRACLEREGLALIMGGTGPHEEAEYQRKLRRSAEWDRWVSMEEMEQSGDVARECGISILH